MTILSTGLETFDYSAPGWNHIYNRNMELLDAELLKLNALHDVDTSALADGAVLLYNSTTATWEVKVNS